MNIFWFLPTHGDGHYLGTSTGGRALTPNYLRQVAQAVDELGYTGALLPTGRGCEDAWLVAASLLPATQRMKFLVAVELGGPTRQGVHDALPKLQDVPIVIYGKASMGKRGCRAPTVSWPALRFRASMAAFTVLPYMAGFLRN